MVDLSSLVHPRAVEFFQRFMDRQAEAAMAVTGAPATTWSRRYSSRTQEVRIDIGKSVASVTWDGDIEYDAALVIQPIWMLCRRAGQDLARYRLSLARQAFRTVLHENLHTLNQPGRTHRQSMEAFQVPANRALEEGLTELAARRYLNAYLRELGAADLAPGILTANDYAEGTYPHFVPAVELLVQRLGERTSLGDDEILRRLISIDCENRWEVVGDLFFDAEGLADVVPEADHAKVKARLAGLLKAPYAHLPQLDGRIDAIMVASTAAGYDSLGSFDQEVDALRLDHDPARRPEQLVDSILRRHQQAALAVIGAHHVTPTGDSVTDLRLTDGSTVGEAVQQMCEHAGEDNQPAADLTRYKEAFHVLLEQNVERSAERFREYGMDPEELTKPGIAVFGRGLARALADDRLNAYVYQLGLERVAPGIGATASPRPPDPATVATRAFIQDIGAEIRIKVQNAEQEPTYAEADRAVLLRQLAGVDPATQWQRLSWQIYDSQPFRGQIESDELEQVRDIIKQSMTDTFAQLEAPVPPGQDPLVVAERIGHQTADACHTTLTALDQALTPPVPPTPVTMQAMDTAQVPTDARHAHNLLTTARPGTVTTRPPASEPRPRQSTSRDPRPAPNRET
jgi:hypothetical protein